MNDIKIQPQFDPNPESEHPGFPERLPYSQEKFIDYLYIKDIFII